MAMRDEDYRLSMKISPRGRIPTDSLRQLLVNRLSDTYKAILRRPLRGGGNSVYCEECDWWQKATGFPATWTCRRCNRSFRIEFAVYEEMEPLPVDGDRLIGSDHLVAEVPVIGAAEDDVS